MINTNDILQTIRMIDHQHLDVRTITMGVSLLDCCDPDPHAACRKIYDKITTSAEKPPMKFTPTALAALSMAAAKGT